MLRRHVAVALLALVVSTFAEAQTAPNPCPGKNTTRAQVVALDQAFYNNRLGAFQPGGMVYALRRDVIPNGGTSPTLQPGQVMLNPVRRPRPMVLRVSAGDCLRIEFQNLLAPVPMVFNHGVFVKPPYTPNQNTMVPAYEPASNPPQNMWGTTISQPATRWAGVHAAGLKVVAAYDGAGQPLDGVSADGTWVGANDTFASATATRRSGLVAPGQSITYLLYAEPTSEGAYLMYSTAATNGTTNGFGGQLSQGLFGSVTVQPSDTEWYRSQVTRADLMSATKRSGGGSGFTQTSKTVFINSTKFPVWKMGNVEVTIADANDYPVAPSANGYVRTTGGQPMIDYGATRSDGTPILKMTNSSGELVYSDLTAIITGPKAGRLLHNPYAPTQRQPDDPPMEAQQGGPLFPSPLEPYREFAIHYHDDFMTLQAFPQFRGSNLGYTLQAGRDFFAINYGIGGIGAEVLANRLGVGPMRQCATCKFEEFFLSSWSNGDPAMVVDIPANAGQTCTDPSNPDTCTVSKGPSGNGIKATKALYPDDPSNVYHSYLSDHVIFQILHAGTNITHVHHLHAQQWVHSPRSQNSAYRDSQMISPGATYTLNHVHNGSGNVNKTVGDSIFHCHFYPHFAQGMWSLWRVHDTFEAGTELTADGAVVTGKWNRAYPDGEIASGTPIVALVPMPTIAMAPTPARTRIVPVTLGSSTVGFAAEVNKDDANNNPGFPFFIPGIGGQRAPHPPLDFAKDEDTNGNPKLGPDGKPVYLDGGLPRFVALQEQGTPLIRTTRWDFTKDNDKLAAIQLDQEGTAVEKVAMKIHATRNHPSFTPEGRPVSFVLNGQPPAQGAPYANPAVDQSGNSTCADVKPGLDLDPVDGKQPCLIRYKAANIQLDVAFNKKGWHYPQTRMLTLWGDVKDTLDNKRIPQPFFFRANSGQIIEYWQANLIPAYYELDDFQIRTPTDIIGQHIHLVKFDVTSSDGAANGWNYEDGTYSPEEVRTLIDAINEASGIYSKMTPGTTGFSITGSQNKLTKKNIPYFGNGPEDEWLGAQVTIQRWAADPVFNLRDDDLTLRTVFTHDHFGPSTHQQTGLYAGLLVERRGSSWWDNESDTRWGSNQNRAIGANGLPPFDGGPTSWQARIIDNTPGEQGKSFREFAIEFADRQLAYTRNSIQKPSPYEHGQNKNYTGWADPANAINAPSSTGVPPPFPELVTAKFGDGTYSANYRSEPLPFRLGPSPSKATDQQQDLSNVFASILRGDPDLNVQPAGPINPAMPSGFQFPPAFTGAGGTDPYTPLLRAYEGDPIQMRILVGAHMSPHVFSVHGVNWLFEPQELDSGYRSAQGMGISEHYEFMFDLPKTAGTGTADYLWETSTDTNGTKAGNWGLMRTYKTAQENLKALPNNVAGARATQAGCPTSAQKRTFNVTAMTVQQATGRPLVYNGRGRPGARGGQQLVDPNAIIYTLDGKTDPQKPVEPLILRAAAGECVVINLTNALPKTIPLNSGTVNRTPFAVPFNINGTQQQISDMMVFFKAKTPTYQTNFAEAFNAQNPYGYVLPVSAGDPTITVAANANQTYTINQSSPPRSYTVSQTSATQLMVLAGIPMSISRRVGLHPTLVAYDVTKSDGMFIGNNPDPTIAPGGSTTYEWYAGRVESDGRAFPVELGSVNLTPSDPLLQHPYGLIGALIIEPEGSTWEADANSNASARVKTKDGKGFREFVAVIQDDVSGLQQTALPPSSGGIALSGGANSAGSAAWLLSGKAQANNSVYLVKPGDVVTVSITSGTHGFTFMNKVQALGIFDILQPSATFSDNTLGNGTYGTAPNACAGTILATLRVKAAAAVGSATNFECTQHKVNMAGTFVVVGGTANAINIGGFNAGTTDAPTHQWALNGVVQPNNTTYKAQAGDVIGFAVDSGFHGITFLASQQTVQSLVDILPISQPFTSQPNSIPAPSYGTQGMNGPIPLAVVVLKKNIPSGTTLPFMCTIHKTSMAGVISITGSGASQKLAGVNATGGGHAWSWNGVQQPNNSQYPLKGGDTISVTVDSGFHGLTFLVDQATVNQVFDIGPGSQPFTAQPNSIPAPSWGTQGFNAPANLATLTVKKNVPSSISAIPFMCTIHKQNMFGTFTFGRTLQIAGVNVGSAHQWALNGTPQANDSKYAIQPGDNVSFSVDSGFHGITFLTDQATVQKVFDVLPGGQPFTANRAGIPTPSWGTPGVNGPAALASLKVKSNIPASITQIPFFCTIHKTSMAGVFTIGGGTQPDVRITGVNNGSAHQWALNSTAQPNNSIYPAKPGDVVQFAVESGFHGITFLIDQNIFNRTFEVVTSSPFSANPNGIPSPSWGTQGFTGPAPLATLKVRADVGAASIPFECTIHKESMFGTLQIGGLTGAPANFTRAFNYKMEPMAYRYGSSNFLDNFDPCSQLSPLGIMRALSNTLVLDDPQTPVFAASAGEPVRIRMLHPAGVDEQVLTLNGHSWQEEPYINASRAIGNNPKTNRTGARDAFGPGVSWDLVIDSAGGMRKNASGAIEYVPGDYLFRTFIGTDFLFGLWGILRVTETGKDAITVTNFPQPGTANVPADGAFISGVNTVNPTNGQMADFVRVMSGTTELGRSPVDRFTGRWSFSNKTMTAPVTLESLSCQGSNCTTWSTLVATGYIPVLRQNISAPQPIAPSDLGAVDQFKPSAEQRSVAPPLPKDAGAGAAESSHPTATPSASTGGTTEAHGHH